MSDDTAVTQALWNAEGLRRYRTASALQYSLHYEKFSLRNISSFAGFVPVKI
jgi:hypothetical protein